MTRLLIAGVGPRPVPGQSHVFAPGLRLHTFAGELIRAGNEVHIAEWPFHAKPDAPAPVAPLGGASLSVLPHDLDAQTRKLEELCASLKPDALIAMTDGIAFGAARMKWDGPLYVDFNGHPMAERQMLGAVHGNNTSLASQWEYVLPALLRTDRFATCSKAQRLALIGELGAAGRINAETCGHDLVDVLRPPVPFEEEFRATAPGYLRGGIVPGDARIILFTGGYNTWLDEGLLFDAVERVLAADPRAWYVSTGGEIEGHVSKVFQRFRAMAEKSAHRDRYKFVGWLKHEEYVDCCLEADVGVMTDRWTLEGELGCRNRLYGWLWGGMRAVATALAEIVRDELGPMGLVRGVKAGSVEAFATALGEELRAGRFGNVEAARRRVVLRERCSATAYYGPLVAWARSPERAPDRPAGAARPDNELAAWMAMMDRLGLESRGGSGAAATRELLDRLAGSRAFRVYLRTHPDMAGLFERVRGQWKDASPDKR